MCNINFISNKAAWAWILQAWVLLHTKEEKESSFESFFLTPAFCLPSNDNLASASREAQTTEDVWMWYSDQLLAVKSETFGVFPNYCSSIS